MWCAKYVVGEQSYSGVNGTGSSDLPGASQWPEGIPGDRRVQAVRATLDPPRRKSSDPSSRVETLYTPRRGFVGGPKGTFQVFLEYSARALRVPNVQ